MSETNTPLPEQYRDAIRLIIRYVIVMIFVALLSGVFFQEATRKLTFEAVEPGKNLEAKLFLAISHGHVFVVAVLLPLALAGALVLARKVGGNDLSAGRLKWLTHGYLFCAAGTLALQFYKGVHYVYSAKGGEDDFSAITGSLFGGSAMLRHGLYGVIHVGMALSLAVFSICLWRSLKQRT